MSAWHELIKTSESSVSKITNYFKMDPLFQYDLGLQHNDNDQVKNDWNLMMVLSFTSFEISESIFVDGRGWCGWVGDDEWRGLTYDTLSGVGFDFEIRISSGEWQSCWMLDAGCCVVVLWCRPAGRAQSNIQAYQSVKRLKTFEWKVGPTVFSLTFPLVVFRMFAIDSHYLPT